MGVTLDSSMGHVFAILLIVLLIGISALCSGLNVALVSLDYTELKRKAKAGDRYAKLALKLRKRTHLTLASILFTNVAVISATSLYMSRFINGFLAGFISTLLIVIFGEIIPQAISVKNSLRAIAYFTPFLKVIIILSYPVSRPLEWLLDKLLGRPENRLQTRQELGLLFSDYVGNKNSELDEDEVEIVRNAIMLSEKHVKDIMVPIKEVYSFTSGTLIDGDKMDEIKTENRSRIPIIDPGAKEFAFIMLKDLVDMDFDENPMRVDQLKQHKTKIVGGMTALDTLFRIFIQAKKHLLIVCGKDEVVGIVTIEDLIEEILGHEIEDERDAEKARSK